MFFAKGLGLCLRHGHKWRQESGKLSWRQTRRSAGSRQETDTEEDTHRKRVSTATVDFEFYCRTKFNWTLHEDTWATSAIRAATRQSNNWRRTISFRRARRSCKHSSEIFLNLENAKHIHLWVWTMAYVFLIMFSSTFLQYKQHAHVIHFLATLFFFSRSPVKNI